MVTLREGAHVTADEIKAFCIAKGPLYSHPRHVAVVTTLPLNGAGKIERAAVRGELAAGWAGSSNRGGEGSDFKRGDESG
jgi:long-chain acyl-CoA synthetase